MNQVPKSKKKKKKKAHFQHFWVILSFQELSLKKKIIYLAVPGLRWGLQDLVF